MEIEAPGRVGSKEEEGSKDETGISERYEGNRNQKENQLSDIQEEEHEDEVKQEEKVGREHAASEKQDAVAGLSGGDRSTVKAEPMPTGVDVTQQGTYVPLVRIVSAKKKEMDIARVESSSTVATQSAAEPEGKPHAKQGFFGKMFRAKQPSNRPPPDIPRTASNQKGWLQGSFKGSFRAASSGNSKTMASRFTSFITGNFSGGDEGGKTKGGRFNMRKFFGRKKETEEEEEETPAEVQAIIDRVVVLRKRLSEGEDAALLFHDVRDCVFALEGLNSSAACPEALELRSRVFDTIQSDADILATQALLVNRNRFEENIGLAEKAIEKFALLELPDEKQRCREIIEVCQTRIEIRDIMETADAQLSAKEYREAYALLQKVMELLPNSLQPSLKPSVEAKMDTCARARKRARQLAVKGYRRAQTLQASTSRFQWEHAHGLLELSRMLFEKSGDTEAETQCKAMQGVLTEKLVQKSLEVCAGHEKEHEMESALKEISRLKSWLEHCKTDPAEIKEMMKAEGRIRRVRGTKLLEILAFLTEKGLEQLIIGFEEAEKMLEQAEADLQFPSRASAFPEEPFLDSVRKKLAALQAASTLWNHCRSLDSDLDFEEKISGMRKAKEIVTGLGSVELQVELADAITELNESRQWHSSLMQKKLEAEVFMVTARDEVLRMKSILSSTMETIQSKAVRNEYAQEYANVRDKLLPAVAKLQDRGVEKYLEVVQATLDDIDHRYAHWLTHQRRLRRRAREMEHARRVREAQRLHLTLASSELADSSDEAEHEAGEGGRLPFQPAPCPVLT